MLPLGILELSVACLVALFASCLTDPNQASEFKVISHLMRVSSNLFDIVDTQNNLILILSIAVFVSIVIKNILQFSVYLFTNTITELSGNFLGSTLIYSLISKPYVWYLQQNTGEMLTWLAWRQGVVAFLTSFSNLVTNIFILLMLFTGLFTYSYKLVIYIFISAFIIYILVFKLLRTKVRSLTKRSLDFTILSSRLSLALFSAYVETFVYNCRDALLSDYSINDRSAALLRAKSNSLSMLGPRVIEISGFAILIMVTIYMTYDINISILETATTISFLAAVFWRALPAIQNCLTASLNIVTYRQYLYPFINYISKSTFSNIDCNIQTNTIDPILNFHNLNLKSISFKYPSSNEIIINNISLNINRGEMVAFIGKSGAGKSTLACIISGLLKQTSGQILLNGKEYNSSFLCYKRIGYIPQSPYIIDATLAENIAFCDWGKPINYLKVETACTKACIDFIEQLPDGLNTILGDHGVRLSGGQCQRIAIARALYSNPDILIFDEATSALDITTEQKIQDTINSLHGDLTVILIAHRLSTVKDCDRLYWLDKGKIRMQGTVDEVLPAYEASSNRSAATSSEKYS
jgi:ABC-type bacteriocin/lantibiotic exporter with double-glycine peptidase domain